MIAALSASWVTLVVVAATLYLQRRILVERRRTRAALHASEARVVKHLQTVAYVLSPPGATRQLVDMLFDPPPATTDKKAGTHLTLVR